MGRKGDDHTRSTARAVVLAVSLFVSSALALVGGPTPQAHAAAKSSKPTKPPKPTTSAPAADVAPKTFCEAWASVRDVRASGLTGVAVIRLQAARYKVLVELSPKDVRPATEVMAEYFAATLALADKPLSNEKQAARLEAVIPKIGDALTTVTRHAVRTCPRSLIRPATTLSENPGATTTVVVAPSGASSPLTTTPTKATGTTRKS